jgi:hypothetical protein
MLAQQSALGCSNNCPPPPTSTPTITPFGNPPATPTVTAMPSSTSTVAATPTPAAFDCDGNGTVTAADVARIVSILNLCPPCEGGGAAANGCDAVPGNDKQCLPADVGDDGCITAADLTRAVGSVLEE